MATLKLDPVCLEWPVHTVDVHFATLTPTGAQFVGARRTVERTARRVRIAWRNADIARALAFLTVFDQTMGGTLPVDFVPPNGDAPFDARFMGPVRVSQNTAGQVSIEAELEERIA